MANIKQKTIGNSVLLYVEDYLPELGTEMFNAQYWLERNKVIGQAAGRGTTFFFRENEQDFVLRHYRRGGLIGKLIKDQYLYTGLEQSRAYLEMHLLNAMEIKQLAVPKAVAARIERRGMYYRADIILQKIPLAKDVFTHLLTSSLPSTIWHKVGMAIRQLHEQQIYHHDLNIHNIMLDNQDKVWLIDFDKCHAREGNSWKNANLQRLQRSLHKEKNKYAEFQWQPQDWQSCFEGYQQRIC
ncbi:3-deoxy-D-manno-octulosonic acid kinase [Paraglaciecola hydrolytica]|uniref:3-deoxy-D-manno-octulosonic acid kinase n=1 Tax=Paraglaciecola hydrolytica TaxID=1799789 RepID=A0A136A3U8_9ALTE|nr:3-deoxy-D-manno-octulosonic acid kinase [Paraglaciecola hydrolytica]KXI29800.1 3-deoxy-D-manno-octulosonic acid kinase [Paraglaciecola hydrolytica]